MTSIRSRLAKAYGLVALGATVVLLFPLYYVTEWYMTKQVTNELRTETSVVHALLREMGKQGTEWEKIENMLTGIAAATKHRVTLIDPEGRAVFESHHEDDSLQGGVEDLRVRPEVRTALEVGIGVDIRESRVRGSEMIYVARQFEPSPGESSLVPNVRLIRMGLSMDSFDRQIRDVRWMFGAAGVIALVSMLIVSRIVSRRVSKPIVELAEIVREIKGGNLDRKLPVRSEDEIGRLAELINEMTQTLQEDIRQLRKLERFRSEFLGNVSHELRTPIFSLIGFLETLLDGAIEDPAVSRQFVEKAYHHAERLDTLLKDLMEISRIESGEMRMSFRFFEVGPLLRQVQEDFIAQARKKNQILTVRSGDKEVSAYGDKDRLRQALGNIVDNAIKYSPEGSEIVLSVREGQNSVTFSVTDNGPGIAQEHLPRIFERFYRIDKNRSREVGGTGLGLAIVKHIVDAHNARIAVTSRPGEGATFEFDLRR